MDAREQDASQLSRSSVKRPWEAAARLPEQSNSWRRALPPIDTAAFRRPSLTNLAQSIQSEGTLYEQYIPSFGEDSACKRVRYEGHADNLLSRENLDLNGRVLQAQAPRTSQNSPHRIAHSDPCPKMQTRYITCIKFLWRRPIPRESYQLKGGVGDAGIWELQTRDKKAPTYVSDAEGLPSEKTFTLMSPVRTAGTTQMLP